MVGARVVVTVLIALVQMAIFLGLGMSAFGLRLTGSWWMAVPLLVAGTLAFMSLGPARRARSRRPRRARSTWRTSWSCRWRSCPGRSSRSTGRRAGCRSTRSLLPLRHLNDGMLDVMVRGQGPSAAFAPIGILLAFAAVVTLVAVRLFRWEAD